MKSYRSLTPAVYQSQLNLRIVTSAATRDNHPSVADVAREYQCSVRHVHALRRRALEALTPGKPGPQPGVRVTPGPVVAAPSAHIEPRALTYVLTTERVSIRGIQTAFDAMTMPVPARDTLVDWLRAAGRAARRLLARARDQVRDALRCLAGDDAFFHRTAVKVLMEPVSGAVLDVMRWRWRKGEEWSLWLGEWPRGASW